MSGTKLSPAKVETIREEMQALAQRHGLQVAEVCVSLIHRRDAPGERSFTLGVHIKTEVPPIDKGREAV